MRVAEIQAALLTFGYCPGTADGRAHPETIDALIAFQHASGLVPDGVAGPLTIAALKESGVKNRVWRAELVEPPWLTIARADVGMIEGPGASVNPAVIALFRDAGFPGIKTDETAWCAAAVGAWLFRAGVTPSGNLAARSYERWGVGLPQPCLGCIGVKTRRAASWQGHVGFVVAASDTKIFMVGGNQADAVSIADFKRADFIAFRWPSSFPLLRGAVLPTRFTGAATEPKQA